MVYKSINEVLLKTTKKYPNKIIFEEKDRNITYSNFYKDCSCIATKIISENLTKTNVALFIDKTINCLEAMFACSLSNACYTIIDTNSPKDRIESILNTLKPSAIITDKKNETKYKELGFKVKTYLLEDLLKSKINNKLIEEVNTKLCDTDPLYILFTSGSTGVPKGTVVCHRSVIDYAYVICKTFNITSRTKFGSQTPFYFSMSILDIFSTIISGATFNIIPKMYFSFPVKLIEYLNEFKINTVYWVPSVLSIVANLKVLDVIKPKYLKKILFAGEVMPTKQLNIWIKKYPKAMYANLYGPTEITDTCTYYIVNRKFKDDESLPIGIPFDNCDVMIINDKNELAPYGEVGELCVRGSFLGLGYYNNKEKTDAVFCQNPVNDHYPELIYRTGDLVKYNKYGEIEYLGRKDFQIKHMGYRIELGEIETNISSIDGILTCVCIYNTKNDKIVLFYQSNELSEEEVFKKASKKLLSYMVPNEIIKLDKMPFNANGKIDRVKLKEMVK